MTPGELEVAAVVWARSLLVSQAAIEGVEARAGNGKSTREGGRGVSLTARQVLIAPVVSEKSYSLIETRKYAFRVHPDAHKTQIRQAVEELFDVKVTAVNVSKVQPKPKRRGMIKGTKQGWKKAIVQVAEGQEIQIFAGAQV